MKKNEIDPYKQCRRSTRDQNHQPNCDAEASNAEAQDPQVQACVVHPHPRQGHWEGFRRGFKPPFERGGGFKTRVLNPPPPPSLKGGLNPLQTPLTPPSRVG